MGCGTGLVGEVMQPKGWDNIVGCDASPGICNVARKKNDGKAYTEVRELFLGQPDKYPEDLKGKFDIVTAAGILAQGHLDTQVFDEFLMACKGPGSLIIFTTREQYLTDFGYGARMAELEAEGKWKKVEELDFYRYDNLGDEVVGRYKKSLVKCFGYQTL